MKRQTQGPSLLLPVTRQSLTSLDTGAGLVAGTGFVAGFLAVEGGEVVVGGLEVVVGGLEVVVGGATVGVSALIRVKKLVFIFHSNKIF